MMIPKPMRLTRMVRKMMASGRVTMKQHFIQSAHMRGPNAKRRARRAWYGLPITTMVGVAAPIVMGLTGLGAQQRAVESTRAPDRRAETLRPEILGTRGIVAAGRHYSVSAGIRILQQGG